jgi:outer membrane protein TolC
VDAPRPPKDRWQAVLGVQQLVYDGGLLSGRRAIERARLAESREGVRAELYRLRAEVNASFFSAFLLQERAAELEALARDLEARLAVVRARVREGTALPGDTAAVQAELLRARQARDEVAAARRASLAVLSRLAGREVGEGTALALPDLADAAARARAAAAEGGGEDGVRARPEFAQFARARERIGREAALATVERRPRVVAFGQAGYGRPGLDQFNEDPDEFWTAGVRLEWRPWDWGTASRRTEALRVEQRLVDTREAAFAESLERGVQQDLEEMDRLAAVVETDDRIIALREQVERQARAQLDEGVITAAEYVEARTDVLDARVERQRHRAALAQARARYLTTLGLEPR